MSQDSDSRTDLPRGIGNPARRALEAAGITTLAQLAGLAEADLLALHGVGPKAVGVIRAALAERGEALRDQKPGSAGQ